MLDELSTESFPTYYFLHMFRNRSNLNFFPKKYNLLAVDVVSCEVIIFGEIIVGLYPNTSAKAV